MMSVAQVERRLTHLQRELLTLGPVHPGSITEQFNACGQPGCRCKDPENLKGTDPITS